jgi:hypothetical protein
MFFEHRRIFLLASLLILPLKTSWQHLYPHDTLLRRIHPAPSVKSFIFR